MILAKKERAYALTGFVIATIFKIAVPFYILEVEFGLLKKGEFSLWKLSIYGSVAVVLGLLYFSKYIIKWIKGMRMNLAKGLIITIFEVAPFISLYLFVKLVETNIPRWTFVSKWIALSYIAGAVFMRASEYYGQEAKEKERFLRYGPTRS